jgi:hypothetical protein
MQTMFDVVDLLQLQEVWVRLPIAQAYSRLERRQAVLPCPMEFSLKLLMPRLGRLRSSSVWRTNHLEKRTDPAQVPMCALTDAYLDVLYPEQASPGQTRHQLFISVYNHFVVSQYRADLALTCALLGRLADVRAETDCLDSAALPLAGSNYWIPIDLTDEIRSLDARYDSTLPDTPAAYVIADEFWPLLVKASSDEVNAVAAQYCMEDVSTCIEDCTRRLNQLIELAHNWNRTSSVVGLYYQTEDAAVD